LEEILSYKGSAMKSDSLRILVVTQYFWPENMRINDLVEGFVARGHDVTVLTGLPNYPEGKVFEDFKLSPVRYSNYAGAKVVRVPMLPRGCHRLTLVLNYLSYCVSASLIGAWRLRGNCYDAIFVYANSPITVAIPAVVVGHLKRVPTFIWILDLWPETLTAVRAVQNGRVLAVVGKMVSWIYNRSDYLLLQSRAFFSGVRQLCTRPISEERLVYFPSWAEDDFGKSDERRSDLLAHDAEWFTIVFAGNIGEAQDFPAILDAAELVLRELRVRWVIAGSGRASEWLEEQVAARGLNNVFLLGRHPLDKMPSLFAEADALLVSLKTHEVFARTIPGKVQAYLASGRPIIAMIDGEAARVVTESGAGMACPSGDSRGLADIVKRMARMSTVELEEMGRAGRMYYDENYSKERLFDQLEMLFKSASRRRGMLT
jgi:glycosyltransferase involved in cell wall biosynthesis